MEQFLTNVYLIAIVAACIHVMVMSYKKYGDRTNTGYADLKYILMGVASTLLGAVTLAAIFFR